MTYHQKAIVCTSDSQGRGKAVYYEDDNGKVTKKTKKFEYPNEMEDLYQKFGFDDHILNMEQFMNFSIPSPFGLLSGLADNFFGSRPMAMIGESLKDILPEGVDVNKHRQRLRDLQEKKAQEEQEKQEKEEEKKHLQEQLEELKNIKKDLKEWGDTDGAKEVEEDIKRIEDKLNSYK